MAEIDAKQLKEFDDRLKSMYGTLGELEGTIKSVGTAITNTFGSATQNMVKEVQQAFRSIQLSDMLGVDIAKRDIKELGKEIATIEGNIKSKTSNGTASYSEKKNKWVYTKGNVKLTEEGEVESIEKLNRLYEKLKYSMMSREELLLRIQQTSGKMYSDEQRDLKKLQQEYYNYEQKVAIAKQNISAYTKGGSDSKQTKEQIAFWQKQADDYTSLMNSADDKINKYRENGVRLSLEEEAKMRLAQQEKLNQIENNKLGYASKEWKKETSQRTKRNADLDKRADEYRKSIEALTKAELELAQAEENLRQKQSGKANGQPYAENTIKGAEKSVAVAKQNIIEAEEATKRFGASLASLKGGAQRLNEIRAAFGLIAESGQEAQKIPTVFDRVIAEINSRSERSKSQLAKSIIDAKSVRDEAKAAALGAAKELSYIWKGASVHGLDALKLRSTFSLTDFGVQGIANQIKLSDQYKANLDALKPEAREKLTEALNRYKEALQQVISLEEQKRRFDENTDKYSAQERAINGVTKRYQENEQAIQKLKDRWEELNVRKQAGLVNEKDFKQNTQKILDEYDRLINKRKEFEIGDLDEMSANRQKRITQIYKDNARARVQDELNADKKIAAERARRARGLASTDPNMNAAVNKQIQYQRQLNALRKEYNTLNAKQDRSSEENVILEQTKKKIKDIITLSRQLNNEQKGSHDLAKQITDYDRIKQKIREANAATKEHEESLDRLIPTLQRLGSAFGMAFSVQGLVQFGKKLIETRGEFEMQFVAMKQIIGDVDAATKIWNQTMQQALQSPFRAMQLVDYTKKLAAYRIETEKLFDTTKRLADVSAGLGVDMGRLILAYGQVKTANYLRASEVRQFTEAGVNIYGELAKYFSEIEGHAVSTAEVVERTSKRMVLFSDVEAIFKRMTDEGGTFFNMQEVQSDTVRGQIMKLHDAYDQMLNTIGQSNQGTIRDLVDTLNKLVRNWQDIAYIIKFNLSVFLPYIAATKIATFGMKKAGDASLWFSNKLIGQRVALSSTNEILKLNSATLGFWHRSLIRATKGVQAFVIGLKSIGRVVLPFAILEGIIFLTEKISEAHRATARLKEDLEGIKFGNAESLQSNIQGFERLKKAIENSNDGSQERLRLIEQMNNKYGDYLPHLITEIDTVQQLNDAYDSVIQSMREYSYAKTKEQGEERIRKEMFEVYNDAVNDLFGTKSNRQVSYGETGSFYLEKHEIQDILKQIQDELIKDPELNGHTLVKRLIANYTGIQEAHVDYAHIWAGYVEDMRKQVKEMQNLERFAEEAVLPSYRSGEERSRAEELRKKAEAELAAANEAWAKEKDSLTHTIEDSVLKGIQDARKEAEKVDREEGESDAEYNMRLWNARVKADEDANKAIKEQHIITNFAIEEKEKEHQARLLKIRLSNQQISAESYNKQMLAIYPELDDRIKQYNDKIRAMVVEQFGEEWSGNADAITLFKQMRIGIDDISQGVAQYQKNFAGTVENQIKIVQDLYDWKERGYNIDENDLNVQREKLAVYVRMARLLGVKTDYNPIGNDLFTDIQRQFNNKYGNKPTPYLPFGNTFFGLEEGDRMLSQIELLDKYTKKWQEYEKTYKTLVESKKNNKDLSEAAAVDLDAQIEEAKKNTEASKFLIDLLGYIAKATRGGGQKESASRLISLIKEMRSEYDKLSKSAYGYAKSEEKVRASFGDSWKAILKEAGVPKDFDFSTNAGEIAALERVRDYVKGNAKFAKDAWKDVQKVIDQLKTESEIEIQVRIREDFGRQMEEAFGNYELTLELQKLNLPSDVMSDLFDLETVDLSDLRRKVVEFYNERLAVEADPTDLIKQVEDYYKKIDDMERKQQRDRIKDYAKYLEYELSERAKIEMEYTRKSADVAANQAFTSEQKEQIQKRLKEERDKAIAKQEWEDFKSSETYIQMMEDLEHQGTNALIAMRTELERVRENAENLSPRALKEVVNALEKIDEITIKRGMPISNIRNAAAGVRSARVEALESGLSWDQVSSRKAAKQTQADIKAQLLPMEQQLNILQSQLGAEKEIARLEKERYENGLKLEEVFGETFMTGDNEYLQELITNSLTNIESSQARINELTKQRKTASEADTKAIDKKLAEERENLACLKAERDLLEKQLELNIAIAKEALNMAATPEERASLQARINKLEEERKKLKGQEGAVDNLTKKYGILGDSAQDAVQKLAGWSQQAVDVFNSFKTMMTSLGVDTDTDAWDDWSTAFETIGTVASTAESMATKIANGDYIGAALDAVKGIMDIVTQWAGNNDKELERQIQKQQERIDDLKDAYARLEKQIERTWSSVSYMQIYEQQVQNIREQIAAMEAQRRAEEAKKNTDNNAVRQYKRDIQDAYDQLEELEQKSIEVFGGIGEEGYRSAAQGFVEAWKSAFLETGDGLQGLKDHFDEFLEDWFVKQATMRVAGKMLDSVFRQIDAAVDKYGEGGTAAMLSEIQKARELAASIFPDMSDAFQELAGMFDISGDGGLSGLAAGIQGMTEEQANILEAYWNSVRMYTANIDIDVERIANILGAGGDNANPMLGKLDSIINNTAYIKRIYDMLEPMQTNNGSGRGFRTYNL